MTAEHQLQTYLIVCFSMTCGLRARSSGADRSYVNEKGGVPVRGSAGTD